MLQSLRSEGDQTEIKRKVRFFPLLEARKSIEIETNKTYDLEQKNLIDT